jgi:RNA polymerase sigma-70 factor, ECF subfamily
MQESPEQALVKEILRGNTDKFSQIVDNYKNALFNLTYRYLGNRAEADEVCQETFLKVYRSLAQYNPAYKFSNWILKIATNEAFYRLRQRRSEDAKMADYKVGFESRSTSDDPENEVAAREKSRALAKALAMVDVEFRGVLVLRYSEGLSYQEIGQVLDLAEGTVKSKIFRGRKILVEILKKEGITP